MEFENYDNEPDDIFSSFDDMPDDDPLPLRDAGFSASLTSTAYLMQLRMKTYMFFLLGAVSLIFALLVPFMSFTQNVAGYISALTFTGFFGFSLLRGTLYLHASLMWERTIIDTRYGEPEVEYLAFRAFGDAFAARDGYKLTPGITGKIWKNKEIRAQEKKQRQVNSIGVAIDAYSAAATRAKEMDNDRACEEVLIIILHLIGKVREPNFLEVKEERLEDLELTIMLYLITTNEEVRKSRQAEDTLGEPDIENTGHLYDFEKPETFEAPQNKLDTTNYDFFYGVPQSELPDSTQEALRQNRIKTNVTEKNFADTINRKSVFKKAAAFLTSRFGDVGKPKIKDNSNVAYLFDNRKDAAVDPVALLERSSQILVAHESYFMAFQCRAKAAEMASIKKDHFAATNNQIDAGLIACLAGRYALAEDMLEESKPGLISSNASTAQKWWSLAAVLADHSGDIAKCEEATLNASILKNH